jgi:hypothetical protein
VVRRREMRDEVRQRVKEERNVFKRVKKKEG